MLVVIDPPAVRGGVSPAAVVRGLIAMNAVVS